MYVNVCIYNLIGMRLAEYEVFVQYFIKLNRWKPLIHEALRYSLRRTESLLTGLPGSYTYNLYGYHHQIADYTTHMAMYHSDIELLLAVVAMELHCGVTVSFYKMLKFIEIDDSHFKYLAVKIRREVETFDPHSSYGMCTVIHIHINCDWILENQPNCHTRPIPFYWPS